MQSPLMQMHHKIPGVTGPKFTNLSEGGLSILDVADLCTVFED